MDNHHRDCLCPFCVGFAGTASPDNEATDMARRIAEHYHAGVGPAPGEHSIIPGVDVPSLPYRLREPAQAARVATMATERIGDPHVTVESRRAWHDGWTLVVR